MSYQNPWAQHKHLGTGSTDRVILSGHPGSWVFTEQGEAFCDIQVPLKETPIPYTAIHPLVQEWLWGAFLIHDGRVPMLWFHNSFLCIVMTLAHFFLCLPLFPLPWTVSCKTSFQRPSPLVTWSCHFSFLFLTVASLCSSLWLV